MIKQIAGSDNRIYALCYDGSLWEMNHGGEWSEHPPLPDSEEPETGPMDYKPSDGPFVNW